MKNKELETLLFEFLRTALLTIRILAAMDRRNKTETVKLKAWAEVVHSIPPILMGELSVPALNYFVRHNARHFLDTFPCKGDTDFRSAETLINELSFLLESLPPSSPQRARPI